MNAEAVMWADWSGDSVYVRVRDFGAGAADASACRHAASSSDGVVSGGRSSLAVGSLGPGKSKRRRSNRLPADRPRRIRTARDSPCVTAGGGDERDRGWWECAIDFFSAIVAVWLLGIVLVAADSGVAHYLRFVRQLPAATRRYGRRLATRMAAATARQRLEKKRRIACHFGTGTAGLLCAMAIFGGSCLVRCGADLARRERSAILRHELAHLVRGDLWWSLAIRRAVAAAMVQSAGVVSRTAVRRSG